MPAEPHGSARVVRLASSPPARGDVDVGHGGAVPPSLSPTATLLPMATRAERRREL